MSTRTKTKRSSRRKSPTRKKATVRKKSTSGRRWSGRVTATSDAMTLEDGIFKSRDPKRIARSVLRSARRSHRRKASPYRSAMSMLTFYENRAGKNLSATKRRILDQAKEELRKSKERSE